MNYAVIFRIGETCKWRCMIDPENDGITSAKWYDANVHQAFSTAVTLSIINDHGELVVVPHYAFGQWEGASEIGILNPELAHERMVMHIQKKIIAQKEDHHHRMNELRNEMRSIDIKGFVDESV
ncbi:hypothetical protein D3C87_1021780 [compost metagenome]